MRVIILTTDTYGSAGHHLPVLLQSDKIDVIAVLVSRMQVNRKKKIIRILKKIRKIGVLGAWNGIKMRKWYGPDVMKYTNIPNLEDTCAVNNIRLEWVPSTNGKRTQALFKELKADLGLSLGNGYISPNVFELPSYGMINIHHELLPQYQNAQSIIWQLYNGSSISGYTIHKIDAGIDTGDILLQEEVPVIFKDTLGETVAATMAELLNRSANGLKRVLEQFDTYNQNARPQGKGNKYTTPTWEQYQKIKKQFKKLKNK